MSSRHFKIFSSKMVTMLKVSCVLLFGTFVTLVSCTLFSANFTPSKVITALQEYYEYIPDIVGNNLLLPWKWGSEADAAQKWGQAEKIFETKMEELQHQYPNQKQETWIQLKATIPATLKENEPVHPAVVLALIPPQIEYSFGKCFLEQVAIAVNEAVRHVLSTNRVIVSDAVKPMLVYESYFAVRGITAVRKELDDYLKTRKSMIVENIDKFTNADYLMVFHGICDNFHAVDRRATVFFPVQVPMRIYSKYKEWKHTLGGVISNEVLTAAWKNVLPENALPALIARVADAVILLEPGDVCQISGESLNVQNFSETQSQEFGNKPSLEEKILLESGLVPLETHNQALAEIELLKAQQLDFENRINVLQQSFSTLEDDVVKFVQAVAKKVKDTRRKPKQLNKATNNSAASKSSQTIDEHSSNFVPKPSVPPKEKSIIKSSSKIDRNTKESDTPRQTKEIIKSPKIKSTSNPKQTKAEKAGKPKNTTGNTRRR